MKVKKLLKGSIFLILGLGIISGIIIILVRYEVISIDSIWTKLFPPKVVELIDPEDKNIYIASSLPSSLTVGLEENISNEYTLISFSPDAEDGHDYVVSNSDLGEYDLVWKKYYVPVVSVEATLESVSLEKLEQLFIGEDVIVDKGTYSIVIDEDSYNFLSTEYAFGVSVTRSANATTLVHDDLSIIGIIPFEKLDSKVKPISVEGEHIWNKFDENNYPLVEEVWVNSEGDLDLFEQVKQVLGPVNYDPEILTTVVVTGTSVMGGRGLYIKSSELGDWIYPIREVADILREADVSHISNESIFIDGCTQSTGTLIFCGNAESFKAFTFAGVDVVGLTGNHIMDYGDSGFLETLNLYGDNGIGYFGGGRDYSDAHSPAVIEVNGKSFAFLGYNKIPPVSSFATNYEPGSAELEMNSMVTDIQSAKKLYDFVLVDMQWGNEYQHTPLSYQVEYGRAAIDAGADIVTGVHPHWVQKLEYYKDGVIFYGLGNLLFDQMWSQKTREGLMVRHYFYGDNHLGFELVPTIIYEGAQPRPVEGDDAQRIINYLF